MRIMWKDLEMEVQKQALRVRRERAAGKGRKVFASRNKG